MQKGTSALHQLRGQGAIEGMNIYLACSSIASGTIRVDGETIKIINKLVLTISFIASQLKPSSTGVDNYKGPSRSHYDVISKKEQNVIFAKTAGDDLVTR